MNIELKLKKLKIELPETPKPLASYIPILQIGNLVFLSGILPLRDGKLIKKGKVGQELNVEEAQKEARQCVINALSILKSYLGSLDRVKRCVKIAGYVASSANFTEQHLVMNGASEFLVEVFEEAGKHTRVAVGVNSLPMDASVEVEFIFEIKE
ncbi:RidA family protein [Thermodesulfovibrio hydrogeniphilus]